MNRINTYTNITIKVKLKHLPLLLKEETIFSLYLSRHINEGKDLDVYIDVNRDFNDKELSMIDDIHENLRNSPFNIVHFNIYSNRSKGGQKVNVIVYNQSGMNMYDGMAKRFSYKENAVEYIDLEDICCVS